MDIQTFLKNILIFLNDTLVPFIIGMAFFFFIWNAARYFVIGGTNEESRQKAKGLAVWGIAAFVVILSLWGIVNLLVDGLDFDNRFLESDYIENN